MCALLSSKSRLSAVRTPIHRTICAHPRTTMLFNSVQLLNLNTSTWTVRPRQPCNRSLSINYLTTAPRPDTHPRRSICVCRRHRHRAQRASYSNHNLRYMLNQFSSFKVRNHRPSNTFKSPQPRHNSSNVRRHSRMQRLILILLSFPF